MSSEEAREPSSALPRRQGGAEAARRGFTLAIPPHAAEVEGKSAAECAAVVGRPHRGGETELDAVGHGDGLGLVGERLYGNHRAKDLDAACHGRVNAELYSCEGVYYYCTYKVCANGTITYERRALLLL